VRETGTTVITVVDYDPAWPQLFEQLRRNLLPVVGDIALAVEHVGSTAVPGLAAKPVIDIDVVVASRAELAVLIDRLAGSGYVHQGDLGIEGREAFEHRGGPIAHHLYGCRRDSVALKNHLTVREYLRTHRAAALEYAALKKRLALQFPRDAGAYVDGKTSFILAILRGANFPESARLQWIHNAGDTG
jgi:GrpB-like predicted nucleotidyltransferase (UPF0157 family)